MIIKNIIFVIASEALKDINKYGYIQAGVNGIYHCEDTPVRNSSHWISIFKYLYKETNNEEYYDAIVKLANYICGQKSSSGAIKCMNDDKMDHLNGSIGQAWTIEGLISAYEVTNDMEYYNKACEIFLSQKYDSEKHLWTRIELDGTDIGYDKVFNHQLWFAAAGFLINKAIPNADIFQQIDDFMKNVDNLFNIYEDGLLHHYIIGMEVKNRNIKTYIKNMLSLLSYFDPKFSKKSYEKGYHLFDLYGFAIIYNCNPSYDVFKSDKLNKAIKYGLDIDKLNDSFNINNYFKSRIFKTNKYAYPYNSPAFEYPYIDYTFNEGKNEKLYEKLYEIQINMTYNPETLKFDRNTEDGETLTARLYELTRYLEVRDLSNEK